MLDKLQECVGIGEQLGADFIEARYEDLTLRTLERTDDIWKEIQVKSREGFGITCYVDGVSGFSYTASPESAALKTAIEGAYKMAKASSKAAKLKLPFENGEAVKSKQSDTLSVKIHPDTLGLDEKTDLVNRLVEAAKDHGENIRNIRGLYGELYGKKVFTNSDGSEIDWNFLTTDLRCFVTSKTDSGAMVIGADGKGGTHGHEIFKEDAYTPEQIGTNASLRAKEQLKAKACPAGKFKSLIEETLVGVLAHESFGHLSEADFIVTDSSPLAGKLNESLGTEFATIVDGGNIDVSKTGGLWLPFDDQGIRTSQTTVLDKGRLNHYLHNRGTANKLNQNPTGNARAVTFMYTPIPRMTNTYFLPGDLNGESEALELLGTGIYAIQSYGGQVQGDGSFLFKAVRGYYVENGEIKYPIREVSLSGNILELLGKVEGATKEITLRSGYFGGCGKGDQFPLPVGLGGPMVVMDGVTFGGQA
ncbi:MAG: TldD/PmbA family protein [Candidatus Thorarchaeota archaeon]